MKKKIKLLLADDHPIFINGLAKALQEFDDINVVAKAANGKEVINYLEEHVVDVLIMDIEMPYMDGFECMAWIKNSKLHVKVLVMSMHEEMLYIHKLVEAGVSGYVPKTCNIPELSTAIRLIAEGEEYFNDEIIENLERYRKKQNDVQIDLDSLSDREKEVLKLIAQEFSSNEIADKLFLSKHTIETHRKNLMNKLQAKNMVGLVKFALDSGLITNQEEI